MDSTFALTLPYTGTCALLALVATLWLKKSMGRAGRALVLIGAGALAVITVAVTLHQLGLMGTIDATSDWMNATPFVGWLLITTFAVCIALPVPCFIRALALVRSITADYNARRKVTARLQQLRDEPSDKWPAGTEHFLNNF